MRVRQRLPIATDGIAHWLAHLRPALLPPVIDKAYLLDKLAKCLTAAHVIEDRQPDHVSIIQLSCNPVRSKSIAMSFCLKYA